MPNLFALAMPWWKFTLRAEVVYAVMLGMARLSGKRALGQVTPFDVLLIVLLGNAVQNALLGTDTSLAGGPAAGRPLILLNYGVDWITARSRRMERLIEGEPVVIARNGKLFDSVLRRELVSRADFEVAMRQQSCVGVEEVELALLETNGHITIITIIPKRKDDWAGAVTRCGAALAATAPQPAPSCPPSHVWRPHRRLHGCPCRPWRRSPPSSAEPWGRRYAHSLRRAPGSHRARRRCTA